MPPMRRFLAAALLLLLGLSTISNLFFNQKWQSWIYFKNDTYRINGLQYPVSLPVINTLSHDKATSLNATSLETTNHLEVSTFDNVTPPCYDVSKFVSFHDYINGRRLGNQIFSFAAVLFVAELTGRRPVLLSTKQYAMDSVFQFNVKRVRNLCPCYTVHDENAMAYDQNIVENILKAGNRSILVSGYRQSWKYIRPIEQLVRRHLVFKDEIRRFAEDFLRRNIPPAWKKAGFVRVGIHVRRGDYLENEFVEFGFTVANAKYFENAMYFFIERFLTVQFIAVSEDHNWIIENIAIPSNTSSNATVNVTYSPAGHSAGQDLAILSLCDHVITSTGTFGWWGAWLANGTTIYYKDWPLPGSKLDAWFKREDFFLPNWIPMSG